ncbi:MAG: hypothetical protein RL186_1016 [Pseudomonadota bacterium]
MMTSGSSPHGRGTQRAGPSLVQVPWFIPAGAGNTHLRSLPSPAPAVHPRVGGEQFVGGNNLQDARGSSPRGRGTPDARP